MSGRRLAAVFVLYGFLTASNAAETPGTLAGSFSVTPSGQASYSVPIDVPSGIAGMKPTIAVNYSSMGAPSTLGYGWGISGFSAITRCGSSLKPDGMVRGIKYDSADNFCLDGQRLIHVNTIAKGANGSEYHKEIDDFTKVVYEQPDSAQPGYFHAYTKSSLELYFGTTNESRSVRISDSSQVIEWRLTRTVDKHGNYIEYHYYRNDDTGEVLPTAISYTGNDRAGVTTSPSRVVRFNYSSVSQRADRETRFVAGSKRSLQRLLNSLETFVGVSPQQVAPSQLAQLNPTINASLARRYKFEFEVSPATQRTRLLSIQTCGEESGSELCVPKNVFEYSGIDYNNQFQDPATVTEILPNTTLKVGPTPAGDFNGDGMLDTVVINDVDSFVDGPDVEGMIAGFNYDGSSYSYFLDWDTSGACVNTNAHLQFGDFNGDGITDVFRVCKGGGLNDVLLVKTINELDPNFASNDRFVLLAKEVNSIPVEVFSGQAFTTGDDPPSSATRDVPVPIIADFDGNGLSDVLVLSPCIASDECVRRFAHLFLRQSSGAGFMSALVTNIPNRPLDDLAVVASDFDSDGKADLVFPSGEIFFSEDNGQFISPQSYALFKKTQIGDFNGDGLSDVLSFTSSGGHKILLSRGDRTFADVATPTLVWDYGMAAGDVNGDGMTDIFVFRDDGDTERANDTFIVLSEGCESLSSAEISCRFVNRSNRTNGRFLTSLEIAKGMFSGILADYNGDGLTDVYVAYNFQNNFAPSKRSFILLNRQGILSDLLVKVIDGLQNEVHIDYKPLTSTVYSKSESVFNEGDLNIRGTMYVVSKVRSSTGVLVNPADPDFDNAFNEVEYSYENARANRLGRGFLGFRTVTAKDVLRGVSTLTGYRQDFPNIGASDFSMTALLATNALVSFSTSTLAERLPTFSGTSAVTHFPFTSRSEVTTYDALAGGNPILSHVVSLTDYDNLGNASSTQVDVLDAPNGNLYRSTRTTNHYENDFSNWVLARLWCAITVNTIPAGRVGAGEEIRVAGFEYYNGHGQLFREITEPGTYSIVKAANTGAAQCRDYTDRTGAARQLSDLASRDALRLTAQYTYDQFGETEFTETIAGDGSIPNRSVRTEYLTDRNAVQPQIRVTNALSHSSVSTFDARWGVKTQEVGPNNLATSWTYDGLGRTRSELRADGTKTLTDYGACTDTNGVRIRPNAVMRTSVASDGGAVGIKCADSLGRGIYTKAIDGDGALDYNETDTIYDDLGRVKRTSRNRDGHWTINEYDALSRVVRITRPDGTTTTTQHNGLETVVSVNGLSSGVTSDPNTSTESYAHLNPVSVTVVNALGQTVRVSTRSTTNGSDRDIITYVHSPYGLVTNMNYTDQQGQPRSIVTSYDQRGRKLSYTDPNMGTWSYSYYPTGDLKTQTDAKNQSVKFEYDALGRVSKRIDAFGTADASTTQSIYDQDFVTGRTWRGALLRVKRDKPFYEEENHFDVLGRPVKNVLKYSSTESYTTQTEYDSFSRVLATIYPNNGPRVQNEYNNRGRLLSITDTIDNKELWRVVDLNSDRAITEMKFGNDLFTQYTYEANSGRMQNIATGTKSGSSGPIAPTVQSLGYRFDGLGTLLYRQDNNQLNSGNPLLEKFSYDDRRRLNGVRLNGVLTHEFRYDALGNLVYKSDVGHLTYDGSTGAGPNAVARVSLADPSVPPVSSGVGDVNRDGQITQEDYVALADLIARNSTTVPAEANCYSADSVVDVLDLVCVQKMLDQPNAASREYLGEYRYDANGSLVSGGGRTVSYASFNKPITMTRTRLDGTVDTVSFDYGSGYQRIRKHETIIKPNVPAQTTTVTYVGGLYEKIKKPDGTQEHRFYVYAAGGLVAIKKRTTVSQWQYAHRDHLGSVDVITDATRNVVERSSFDAFGQRRNATGWVAGIDSEFTGADPRRGFTGHEQLDGLGLVHMNGRIYDPVLGRFMSADPIIHSASDLQTFNRYAYVRNNPLSLTDPTGYDFSEELSNFTRGVVTAAVTIGAGAVCAPVGAGPACAAAAAYAIAYSQSGGNAKAAQQAGWTAAFSQYVGEYGSIAKWSKATQFAVSFAGTFAIGTYYGENNFSDYVDNYIKNFPQSYVINMITNAIAAAIEAGIEAQKSGTSSAVGEGRGANSADTLTNADTIFTGKSLLVVAAELTSGALAGSELDQCGPEMDCQLIDAAKKNAAERLKNTPVEPWSMITFLQGVRDALWDTMVIGVYAHARVESWIAGNGRLSSALRNAAGDIGVAVADCAESATCIALLDVELKSFMDRSQKDLRLASYMHGRFLVSTAYWGLPNAGAAIRFSLEHQYLKDSKGLNPVEVAKEVFGGAGP